MASVFELARQDKREQKRARREARVFQAKTLEQVIKRGSVFLPEPKSHDFGDLEVYDEALYCFEQQVQGLITAAERHDQRFHWNRSANGFMLAVLKKAS